jgi:hypothetical protein
VGQSVSLLCNWDKMSTRKRRKWSSCAPFWGGPAKEIPYRGGVRPSFEKIAHTKTTLEVIRIKNHRLREVWVPVRHCLLSQRIQLNNQTSKVSSLLLCQPDVLLLESLCLWLVDYLLARGVRQRTVAAAARTKAYDLWPIADNLRVLRVSCFGHGQWARVRRC